MDERIQVTLILLGKMTKMKFFKLQTLSDTHNIIGSDAKRGHDHVTRSGEAELVGADYLTVKADILIPEARDSSLDGHTLRAGSG